MFTGFYLTNKGANLLAKSQAGVVINFTKVGIGKGDLPPGTSITSVTALFNKVKDLPIAGVSANNGQAQIGFQFINTGITTSFLWKELGIYATDPDEGEILYAYGHTTEPDPIPSESQLVEFLFNMIVKISNTTQITATINNSLIYATKEDLLKEVKIVFSEVAPTENLTTNTYWFVNMGQEINFEIGGGIVVQNATTSDTAPDTPLWFETGGA